MTNEPPNSKSRHSWRGVACSLLFWLALITSAALYAGVALAPKLVSIRQLTLEFRGQQARLLKFEQQSDQLERVVQALQNDPQFSGEIARLEFDAKRPGDEHFQVESGLIFSPSFHANGATVKDDLAPHGSNDPWLPRWHRLASDQPLRNLLLGVAATIVILAFTFLQDSETTTTVAAAHPERTPSPGSIRRFLGRYHKPAQPAE